MGQAEQVKEKKFGRFTEEQWRKRISAMFTSAAPSYDLVNTMLSLGMHFFWKKKAVAQTSLEPGGKALDLCSGTGDLALMMSRMVGSHGHIEAVDFNVDMLNIARERVEKKGLGEVIVCRKGDAESLDYPDECFDAAIVGFGIRNVVNYEQGLREMYRTLKPGGRMVILEFSLPEPGPWKRVYDFYSFKIMPQLGTFISKDKTGVYYYLPKSIRRFPGPKEFTRVISEAGFSSVGTTSLTGGIATIYRAVK